MRLAVCGLFCFLFALGGFTGFAAEEQQPQTAGEVYPEAAIGLLENAELRDLPGDVIAVVNGEEITSDLIRDLIERAPEEERQMLEDAQVIIVSQVMQREVLLAEANREGLVPDEATEQQQNEAIMQLIQMRIGEPEVTEEELREAYEELRPHIGEQPFEAVKEQLRFFVIQQKQMQMFADFMEDLAQESEVAVDEEWIAAQHAKLIDNPLDNARRNGQATMAAFTAEWCEPCQEMKPVIEEIEKEQEEVNIVKVDVDEQRILAMRYAIEGVPTFIFFDDGGNEVARQVGPTTKEDLERQIEEARNAEGATAAME